MEEGDQACFHGRISASPRLVVVTQM